MMLTQFAIEYCPRPAIKGQALADFLVECTAREQPGETCPMEHGQTWGLSTDGSSSKKGAGGGVVITSPEGFKLYYALLFRFTPTNNEAEYEALLGGIDRVKALGATTVKITTDSALVVGQVLGTYEAKGDRLIRYRDQVVRELATFETHSIQHIPRSENADADILSKLVHQAPEHISGIARIEEVPATRITDLINYLQTGELPEDDARARKAKLRAPRFEVLEGKLYRRSYGRPLMRCLNSFEADLVMTELHSGICSAHQGGRSLARRIMLIGYYWPSIQIDCEALAKKCKSCQRFAKLPGRPATFYKPIVTDNKRQFENKSFQNFSATLGTRSTRTSAAYLQGNGQVENANRTILSGLKRKLDSAGRSWAEELPYILWAYRTTPREAIGETPFALVYGSEAKLPIEVWIPTRRQKELDLTENESLMATDLDLLDERRHMAARRIASYQQRVKTYHDSRTRPRYFQVGDYVLWKREASRPQEGGKLAQAWEGPYVIATVIRLGTYRLKTTTGKDVDRIWSSENLVLYYH
ncbi:uncharacterized protein LOC115999386 [Ipomoea triloba]|uniref:uncharacterized protein LOC115999386 n=1 Tax=Ipomoea triloba TaxID=35885 RepID=UPI00125CF184|nr:uncharacterized protein LOC115999386 [Ipomoea triloba]